MANDYTPMMKQYFKIKRQYQDCILMYRLGDFYEMFFDDALTASKTLDITLTGRDCGQEERAPMCGVPFHAVESYIAKLIEAGFRVAICEQCSAPNAKGIVEREVIRVVTPGTILDAAALDDKKNNYLASLCIEEGGIGISFVDITTGALVMSELPPGSTHLQILNELLRYAPSEVICNLRAYEDTKLTEQIAERFDSAVHNFYQWAFEQGEADANIRAQFDIDFADLGIEELPIGRASLGGLLSYLKETQKTELANLRMLEVSGQQQYMELDIYSMRNLELLETMREKKAKGSLFSVLNATKTSMGSRLLRKWITMPLVNCAKIQNRHLAVQELLSAPILREEIAEELRGIQDIERLIGRISYKTANCRDLLALSVSFEHIPKVAELLSSCSSGLFRQVRENMDELSDLRELIFNAIDPAAPITLREGKLIRAGYHEEVDRYRSLISDGTSWINEFAEKEKEKTGIKNIKVGYNRVFGYYLEVSKVNSDLVPDYFVRKQTLSNCERYITPEIKEVEQQIVEAESKIVDLEYQLFCGVRDTVAGEIDRILQTAQQIALVDVLYSFAVVAERNGYVMPVMNLSNTIQIKDGRHPVIERLDKNGIFIPNDAYLDDGENMISIITGPNMAGKSTYMRQVALIVLMAQMGSFVPASHAELGIVDKIFTRVGASDDLTAGQSTFMVEMSEVAYILDNATKKSLVILDEIGRGTSTFDGLSIAWAVVEYLADKKKCGAKTLFATHYHELTELEDLMRGVKNYCIAVKKNGDEITFLRKIIRGGADESYGIEVAALAGVKKEVISRAKKILKTLDARDGSTPKVKKSAQAKPAQAEQDAQLNFLLSGYDFAAELRSLDLNAMTPVEALTKLFDLQAKAKEN